MPVHRRWWSVPLILAGAHSALLSAYHFVLPLHMQWKSGLAGVPDSLVWALYALNFSWSTLVFLTALVVLRAAVVGPDREPFVRFTVFMVGLFWALHGAYTWIHPMPLPRSLQALRIVLGAFPALVVILHWMPLVLFRTARRASFA